MAVYYITILVFIFFSAIYKISTKSVHAFLYLTSLSFLLVIYGSRTEVGVDWFNYIDVMHRHFLYRDEFITLELAYKYLNVYALKFGLGISFVIAVTTILFSAFTIFSPRIARINPYEFFVIVAPYHLIMSGMNYIRQSVALSIFLLAVCYLLNNKKNHFLIMVVIASLFHTSVIAFFPLYFIDKKNGLLFPIMLIIISLIFIFMLGEYSQYLDTSMNSSGFILRLFYLILPSLFLIKYYRYVHKNTSSIILSRMILVCIISVPLLILIWFISSTMADRFSYYFILIVTLLCLIVEDRFIKEKNILFNIKPYLFLTSLSALFIWHIFSRYSELYQYNSIINFGNN